MRRTFAPRERGHESQGLLGEDKKASAKRLNKEEIYAGLRRILTESKEFKGYICIGCVFLLLSSLLQNALPALAGQMLDAVTPKGTAEITPEEAKRQLNKVTTLLVVTALAAGICTGIRGYIFNSTSERVVASVRCKLFRALLKQEMGFFDGEKTGNLLSRITADTEQLKEAATTSVSIFLRSSANVTVGLGMMFFTSWRLTLLTLSVTPAASLAVMVFGRKIRNLSKATSAAAAEAASVAGDSLGAIRVVKAFGRESAEAEHFQAAVGKTLDLGITYARANGVFSAGSLATMIIVISLVFWFGGLQVINGSMTIGSLQAFVLYTLFISGGLAMLASVGVSLLSAIGASARVFELMDREPALSSGGRRRPFDGVKSISAELQAVHFAFPSRPDVWVLKGLDLEVPAGKTVALVGPSGAGKSTVTALLMRFYDPVKGAVLLGGVQVSEIDEEHLRSAIAIVSQEPLLFARSIRENITFALDSATDEQVKAAAEQANAISFIESYPEGFDTYVGERGIQLSGGQKQRISIARALLASPKLLILDEATSALDAASEHLVVQALDRLMADRTALVVAHRLSTVKSADVVCVLSEGIVKERGPHEELLARGGVYHALVQRQITDSGAILAEPAGPLDGGDVDGAAGGFVATEVDPSSNPAGAGGAVPPPPLQHAGAGLSAPASLVHVQQQQQPFASLI